ncbi:uncharacterized protein LOC121382885 isoform X2 [Gigantopelta aegis]|uniref:uncharacterized protein LOC121382885 isoform X2 n=1 Tax=Gigantopelta aegis TaxID=1735272 RepID=UPI001B887B21|nr:uncharacterized protein LOC121382885 isoform X2 [Gigantopelta aegis]
MSFELEESLWFALQSDSDSEIENIRQEPQGSSSPLCQSISISKSFQTRNESVPSSSSQVCSTRSTSHGESTCSSDGSVLSQHSLPVSHRQSTSHINSYSLNPCVQATSNSESNNSLSQHSLPVSHRSSSHSYCLNHSVKTTSHSESNNSLSQHSFPVLHRSSSSSHIHNYCLNPNIQTTSTSESNNSLSQHSFPVLHRSSSSSHIHNYSLNPNVQTTSTSESNNSLSQHSFPVLHRSSSSSHIHNYCLNPDVQTTFTSESNNSLISQHSLLVVHGSSSSSHIHKYSLNSDVQTTSTSDSNNSLSQHSLPVAHGSSSSSHIHNYSLNSDVQTTSNSENNKSFSRYSHPVSDRSSCNIRRPSTGNSSYQNRLSVSAESRLLKFTHNSLQTSSKSDYRNNSLSHQSLPVTDKSSGNSASQTIVGSLSDCSPRMDNEEQSTAMDNTASQQFETLLADSSQDTNSKLSYDAHGYSTDDTSKDHNLSEYPIDTLSRSPTSDQAATEDNSDCDEVVHCAISEVSKDFLSGNFSTHNVQHVESDSSQVSSDNEVKLAERSVHGKYPETAAGMSDSDWNPYVTESDSNASPRMEIAQSSVKGASVSTVSLFSPPLSSTNNTTSRTDTLCLTGSSYGYVKGQSPFAQNLTRSEENLRSFLGRDIEKKHLESHGASQLRQPGYMKPYSPVTQLGDSVSKDHAVGAQHAASYLTKSDLGNSSKEVSADGDSSHKQMSSDGDSSRKQMSSDGGSGDFASDLRGDVSKESGSSQIQSEKELSRTTHSSKSRSSQDQSDYRKSYSATSLPENVSKYMESLPTNQTLSSGANRVLSDIDNLLKSRMEENESSSHSIKKDKHLYQHLPKEVDAVEQEVLSTVPKGSDFVTSKALSRSTNSGSTYSSTSKEVQHLLEKDSKLEIKAQSETEHNSQPGASDDGILRTRVNDILTKTSYLESDQQTESTLYDAGQLPSSIDYSQLQHDLQEIQKSLKNFSERGDSESGSECSVKLDSKDASFVSAGSTKEGTIIPSTTTTPDRLTVQRRRFEVSAEGQPSVRTSQEDDTDQSDDLQKYGQSNKKSSQYNSEGEETHGSSCSAKGESDSGQKTPTFSSLHRGGDVQGIDEFLQNVRYQRSLILSQQGNDSVASGMADQISHILQEDNPRRQAHGILQEVDARERELIEKISSRHMVDFSFTDTSANYSQDSLIITDEDVRKQLHLSGLSSLDTSSYSEGYSDILKTDRPRSPFSAFKEARRFMSKQMEMVADRSFNHSLELRTPYRPVLSTFPVYGFMKDSDTGSSHSSRRSRRYEHFGVKEAWQRQHSDRSQRSDRERNQPEGSTEVSTSSSSHLSQPRSSDDLTHSHSNRGTSSLPQRELPTVEQGLPELEDPDSVDSADIDFAKSFTDRRMASSPMNDVKISAGFSGVTTSVEVEVEYEREPSESRDTSSHSSLGGSSPMDSDGNTGHSRKKYRPYRPAGSNDMFYTESDTTESYTTLESTHTGSDDAVPPYFPSHVLGSRTDLQPIGIASSGVSGSNTQPSATSALSTIEERPTMDERSGSVTGVRSNNGDSSSSDHNRPSQADVRAMSKRSNNGSPSFSDRNRPSQDDVRAMPKRSNNGSPSFSDRNRLSQADTRAMPKRSNNGSPSFTDRDRNRPSQDDVRGMPKRSDNGSPSFSDRNRPSQDDVRAMPKRSNNGSPSFSDRNLPSQDDVTAMPKRSNNGSPSFSDRNHLSQADTRAMPKRSNNGSPSFTDRDRNRPSQDDVRAMPKRSDNGSPSFSDRNRPSQDDVRAKPKRSNNGSPSFSDRNRPSQDDVRAMPKRSNNGSPSFLDRNRLSQADTRAMPKRSNNGSPSFLDRDRNRPSQDDVRAMPKRSDNDSPSFSDRNHPSQADVRAMPKRSNNGSPSFSDRNRPSQSDVRAMPKRSNNGSPSSSDRNRLRQADLRTVPEKTDLCEQDRLGDTPPSRMYESRSHSDRGEQLQSYHSRDQGPQSDTHNLGDALATTQRMYESRSLPNSGEQLQTYHRQDPEPQFESRSLPNSGEQLQSYHSRDQGPQSDTHNLGDALAATQRMYESRSLPNSGEQLQTYHRRDPGPQFESRSLPNSGEQLQSYHSRDQGPQFDTHNLGDALAATQRMYESRSLPNSGEQLQAYHRRDQGPQFESRSLPNSGEQQQTYHRWDPVPQFDTNTLPRETAQTNARTEFSRGTGSLEQRLSRENPAQVRETTREMVAPESANRSPAEKASQLSTVYVRDSATSPIIAYHVDVSTQKPSSTEQPTMLPPNATEERYSATSSRSEEMNAGPFEFVRSPTDISIVKSKSNDLAEARGKNYEQQKPEWTPDFTAYEANVPRNTASGSLPPQLSVIYSKVDMPAQDHSATPMSPGMNSSQQDTFQSTFADQPNRQTEIQDKQHLKPEIIQSQHPRSGRSELSPYVLNSADQPDRQAEIQDEHLKPETTQSKRHRSGRSELSPFFLNSADQPDGQAEIQDEQHLKPEITESKRSRSGRSELSPYVLNSADHPNRQAEIQDEQHPKPETTQSKRPRSGRSELRDRIVQKRNSRIPDNSTSEEELEQRIDKTPVSRKAQLLRETLEQELDLSIAPNINTMWQRFQELNSTETDSTMNTSRMETLAHLVRNPTKHTVQSFLNQREQGRQQREEQVAEEREQRRKEVKNAKLHVSRDSDALYSIPENNLGTPSKLKSPKRKREIVIDPNMTKLRDKIQRQKDKMNKERKKELRRMEKLMKLEHLLKAKRTGKISSRELSQSIDDVSSTTIPTESSPDLTSNESTISVSSNMSDAPTEETTAKDSSLELHLAKLAKGHEDTMGDLSMFEHLYKEAVQKHFHSKDTGRPSEQTREPEQRHLRQMLKGKGKQNHQQLMKERIASFKENIESFDNFSESREVHRHEKKWMSPAKNRKSASVSPLRGRSGRYSSSKPKSRDVGTIVPTPCNKTSSPGKDRSRRTRSEAVQTSPYLCVSLKDLMKARSSSPQYNVPFFKKKSRSCSPPFSTRYTPEVESIFSVKQAKNTTTSKGISWFVELNNDDRPWKKSTKEDHVWRPPPKEDRNWSSPLEEDRDWKSPPVEDPSWRSPLKERQEKVREVVHIRPVVKEHEQSAKNDPVKQVLQDTPSQASLQDSFSQRMAWFVSRSRERQKRVALAARERHMQEMFRLEHEKLFGDQRKNVNLNAMNLPLCEQHHNPQKRLLTKQEQKELTEKIYKRLPEVVNGKMQRRMECQKQLNRLRARLFNKKVQRTVLRKSGVLA